MEFTIIIRRLSGEEDLTRTRVKIESVIEAREEPLRAPDHPQHHPGQGEDRGYKLDDPGPGAEQDAQGFFYFNLVTLICTVYFYILFCLQ